MEEKKKSISIKEIILNGMSNFVVVAALIVLFFMFYKFDSWFGVIKQIVTILLPVILGIVLAYLLAPLVERVEVILEKGVALFKKRFLEEHIPDSETEDIEVIVQSEPEDKERRHHKERKKRIAAKTEKSSSAKKKNSLRLPAILLCIVGLLLMIYLLLYMVIPEIIDNITNLMTQLPGQVNKLYINTMKLIQHNQEISNFVTNLYNDNYRNLINNLTGYLSQWLQNDLMDQISMVINGVVGIINFVVDAVISIIVAIYVLMSKENFKRQFKKITVAFFSESQTKRLYTVIVECDKIFGGFISGKVIDSLIIGAICFVGAVLLNLPYAMLISVIVGITNIIPFFGPYIGAVPSAILIFLVSPSKGLEFIVFILLLQQFDGNILGPRILGESVGLSPFWIIFSILLGSGLFGVVGMLIGVPMFGVIYYLAKSFVNYKLLKKGKTEYI